MFALSLDTVAAVYFVTGSVFFTVGILAVGIASYVIVRYTK